MQTVMTNSGVELRVESNIIYTTDSKAFWRSGNMLVGNGTVISYQCRSMDEAVDMVAALYNGKKANVVDSCSGFIGDDLEKNGILNYICDYIEK